MSNLTRKTFPKVSPLPTMQLIQVPYSQPTHPADSTECSGFLADISPSTLMHMCDPLMEESDFYCPLPNKILLVHFNTSSLPFPS